jgi:hypothetical protein
MIMITQQYAKKIQQQAQAPTAVKEPLWRVMVFCILGIALPLVAGSMVWWVAVFAAVAWIVGEFLSLVVRRMVEGSSFHLQTWDPFWSVQIGLICMALMPLFLGMVIGASGGLALGKRGASRP